MKTPLSRHPSGFALLILVLATLLLLAPALRPGYIMLPANLPFLLDPLWQPLAPPGALNGTNPVLGDQFYQYHAWQFALRQSLAHGEIPWWHAASNGGQPLLANGQVGLFDPFNLVGLLFPITASYAVGALLRLWVAGIFTYLYARTIGLSCLAASCAMLVFALSGPLVSWLGATPSHVLVWFPALLWASEKLLAHRSLAWALATSGIVALLLFSSQPEIAFQVALVWGVYLLLRAAWLEGSVWIALRRHAGWWLLVAMLGVALAAVEVLPFVDALLQSSVLAQRADSPSFDAVGWLRRALFSWQEWPTLVTTLLPHFLGREIDESNWYPTGNSIENNAYAGVLPLLLALLAIWHAWRGKPGDARPWVWLWGGLGFGTLGLALGLPLLQALNDLPPLSLVESTRFRGLYTFAVAILAGVGLDTLRAHPSLRRPLIVLLLAAAGFNILLVTTAYVGFTRYADTLLATGRAFMEANVGSPALDRPLAELYALVETRHHAKLAMLHPSNLVMYLPLLVGLLVGMILWWHHARRSTSGWLAPALIVIATIDLLWTGAGINAAVPAAWLGVTPPAVTYLQQQPGEFRVVGTQLILNPNMSMITQLEDVRGYDPITTHRYQTLLSGLDGFAPAGYHNYFRHVDDPRFDLFNAAYALSSTPPIDVRWQAAFADPSGVTVYHNPNALPRAYLVYAAEVVATPAQSLAATLDPSFDARHRVVLEQMPDGWTPPTSPPHPVSPIVFSERRATFLRLEVETPVPAILVLLDSYTPGWRATINNQSGTHPTPIYPANHAFRAIVVPAGQHTVTFTYAPRALTLGIAISALALVVVLALSLWLQSIGRGISNKRLRDKFPRGGHLSASFRGVCEEESPLIQGQKVIPRYVLSAQEHYSQGQRQCTCSR